MHPMMTKAKAQLILDQPFFASILLSLPLVQDDSIPTMATNGDVIKYSAKFVDSLTLQEITFVLAHETLHCVFLHMHRRGDKNANRWNQAADYIINQILVDERVGRMPKGGLLDKSLVTAGEGTAEGVYKLLPAESDDKQTGDDGGALDSLETPSSDPAECAAKEAEMRVKVIQARNAAKMQGKLSAGLDRALGIATKRKTDWRQALRNFLSVRARLEPSFAKPKRRFLAEDFYLPSLTGEKIGPLVVAVDCSGSVDEDLLAVFSAEINAIVEDTKPPEVRIIYFDHEVLKTDVVTDGDAVALTPVGGGGTAFSPVIDAVNALDTEPVALIFLTDLQCSDFGDCPAYPVLWATTDLTDAPYGEILEIKE